MSREQMVAKARKAIEAAIVAQLDDHDLLYQGLGQHGDLIAFDGGFAMTPVAEAAVDAVLEVLGPDEVWEWKTPKSEEL